MHRLVIPRRVLIAVQLEQLCVNWFVKKKKVEKFLGGERAFAIVSDRIVALFCKVKLFLKLHPCNVAHNILFGQPSDDRSTMKIRDGGQFTFDFAALAVEHRAACPSICAMHVFLSTR